MKVAVASVNLNFFGPVEKELARRHTVQFYLHSQDHGINMLNLGRLGQWADLVFVEFAQYPLEVVVGAFAKKHIVVRMHRVEMYSDEIYIQVDWNAVDLVIFGSEHVKERFYEKLDNWNLKTGRAINRPMRSEVIPDNVYDPELFKWVERKFEKPYQMCTVGYLTPLKGQYSLIRMFADLPDYWHLNIVGERIHEGYGNTEYEEQLKDLIESLGLRRRVKLLGSIPHHKLPEFFATQHIIVNNSHEEGAPLTISEAMATGCYPLIARWRGANNLYHKDLVFSTPKEFAVGVRVWESWVTAYKLTTSKRMAETVKGLEAQIQWGTRISDLVDEVLKTDKIAAFYNHTVQHPLSQGENERLKDVNEFLKDWIKPDMKVLELGCGIGISSRFMAELGADVVAVDIGEENIKQARKNTPESLGVRYLAANILSFGRMGTPSYIVNFKQLPDAPDHLDEDYAAVVMIDFIEHVSIEDEPKVFELVKEATEVGSLVIISMPSVSAPRGGILPQPIDEIIDPKYIISQLARYGFTEVLHDAPCLGGVYHRLVLRRKE